MFGIHNSGHYIPRDNGINQRLLSWKIPTAQHGQAVPISVVFTEETTYKQRTSAIRIECKDCEVVEAVAINDHSYDEQRSKRQLNQ